MPVKALDFILSEPWAIQEESLKQIIAIASRTSDMPLDALAAKIGRPLDNTQSVSMRDDVAVIPVIGPIFRYANLFTAISGATSLEVLARDFSASIEDRAVSRIVLEIDSPGGHSAGISEFADMVRQSGKQVTAYISNVGASAAYWIASAANEVVVSDTSLLGSIGVVGSYSPDKSDTIQIVSSQSPLKRATPETEAGRAEMQRVVDELADVFVSSVATYRGVDRETVLTEFGRGGMLVGEKAVSAGMADRIGSFESIIAGQSGEKEVFAMPDKKMDAPEITRQYLAENHPDIVAEIEADASVTARAEGAKSERDRIQSVYDQEMPGHTALINKLAMDGHTTGQEAAVQVVAAEKASRETHLDTSAQDAPAPLRVVSDRGEQGKGSDDTFEKKVEAFEAEGMPHGKAMLSAVRKYPGLHSEWLDRINRRAG